MTTTPTLQNSLRIVHDYYMPGRELFEPGVNALVGGTRPDDAVTGGKPSEAAAESNFFGTDGLNFADLVDILNPLQHLPIVGDLYRSITGDQISNGARIAGGTLYGGPLGFLSALANSVVEDATGRDIGANLLAQFSGDGETDAMADSRAGGTTLTAQAATAPAEAGEQLAGLAPVSAAPGNRNPVLAAEPATITLPVMGVNSQQAGAEAGMNTLRAYPTFLPAGEAVQLPRVAAAGRSIPELSPAAFQMLMGSVNGSPPAPARQGLTAGAELPPVHKGSIREAGMEINQLLRQHAQGRGQPQN